MDTTSQISLSAIDWLMVGLFLAAVIVMSVWVRFSQKNSEDYFLGGRSIGWVVVMFSTFATLFSTISFVSIPGEGYQHGMLMGLIDLARLAFLPLGIWLFLRFFFTRRMFTAYEYLEERFNVQTRLLGSTFYCVVRLIYSGTVFYATAQIFHSMVGWSPWTTILIVGGFTIIYSSMGGMKAVMYTDVIQGIFIIVGVVCIVGKLLMLTDGHIGAMYQHASEHTNSFNVMAEPSFYRLDLRDRISLWLVLSSGFFQIVTSLGADQSVIQRVLSSRSFGDARKALYVQALLALPVVIMLYLIGIGLRYYYTSAGGQLPEGMTSDHVMGYFINTQLPTPLPGLITAAMLAALMSTIDSTVNCISNVIHRDFFVRLGWIVEGSKNEMNLCRVLSIFAGVVGVALALLMTYAGQGIRSSIYEVSGVWSCLWNVMAAIFLLGVLVPFISGRAMFYASLLGAVVSLILPYICYYTVPADERIGFIWLGFPGFFVTIILAFALSTVFRNKKNVTHLTHWAKQDKPIVEVKGTV